MMRSRSRPLDRRELFRWATGAAVGLTGIHLLGACGDGADQDLVDAFVLDDGAVCRPTTSDVLGPYYRAGAPSRATIASPTEAGDRLLLDGVVLADDCATPLVGAVLDVWQADKDGTYYEPMAGEPYRLRGKLTSAGDGTWQLATIRPGNYQLGTNAWRPAHIHVTVTAPGYRTLTTQLYFAGDPFLPPNDGCSSCGSDDPARILVVSPGAAGGLRSELRVVLARA